MSRSQYLISKTNANIFREIILKTAKSLVEDTKTLVAGAASNQEQLASAAQSAVMTITRLADSVKQGAASLGSEQPEAQVKQRSSSLSFQLHDIIFLQFSTILDIILVFNGSKMKYMAEFVNSPSIREFSSVLFWLAISEESIIYMF